MRAIVICTLGLFIAQTYASAANLAAGGKGMKVLPKLNATVKVGTETIDRRELPSPWIVQDVNGEMLLVGRHRKGWVRRSQVVTLDEALVYYTHLINTNQSKAWAYGMRGLAWYEQGNLESAIADYDEELQMNPTAATYINRGLVWRDKKEYDKALADFEEAFRADPTDPFGFNDAARLRATCPDEQFRNGRNAVQLATKANELTDWTYFGWLDTLAAAYAEAGDFDSAVKFQNKAIELNSSDAEFVTDAKERLELYKDHKPCREE